jgi:prevent-host-death family protein
MKTVTVTEAEAGIARLLRLVRKGETVVIVSRGKPVAEIRPAAEAPANAPEPDPRWGEHLLALARQGKIVLPKRRLNLERIRATRAKLPSGAGVLDALLAEREGGR